MEIRNLSEFYHDFNYIIVSEKLNIYTLTKHSLIFNLILILGLYSFHSPQ